MRVCIDEVSITAQAKELSDMTWQRKAESLKYPKQPRKGLAERPRPEEVLSAPVSITYEHKPRKAGKRSNPAFRPTTIFVRKETQRKATRLLEDQDTGKDFSDLVEELVANWIDAHSHA